MSHRAEKSGPVLSRATHTPLTKNSTRRPSASATSHTLPEIVSPSPGAVIASSGPAEAHPVRPADSRRRTPAAVSRRRSSAGMAGLPRLRVMGIVPE